MRESRNLLLELSSKCGAGAPAREGRQFNLGDQETSRPTKPCDGAENEPVGRRWVPAETL